MSPPFAALETFRSAHADVAHQGACTHHSGCWRGTSARRKRRAGGASRRRWRASFRHCGAGGSAADTQARSHRRRRRPCDATRLDGGGRIGRGLRAVRRTGRTRTASFDRRDLPSVCNGGTNCSNCLRSALPARWKKSARSPRPVRTSFSPAILSGTLPKARLPSCARPRKRSAKPMPRVRRKPKRRDNRP